MQKGLSHNNIYENNLLDVFFYYSNNVRLLIIKPVIYQRNNPRFLIFIQFAQCRQHSRNYGNNRFIGIYAYNHFLFHIFTFSCQMRQYVLHNYSSKLSFAIFKTNLQFLVSSVRNSCIFFTVASVYISVEFSIFW